MFSKIKLKKKKKTNPFTKKKTLWDNIKGI